MTKTIFVVMIHKERSQYQSALEAFDNREAAEKSAEHQLKQGGVSAWVEEIPAHIDTAGLVYHSHSLGERIHY